MGVGERSSQVVRADGALEPVEHEKPRCAVITRARSDAPQLDLVAVGHRPALDARLDDGSAAHELAPERTEVRARYPPRGGIGILAGAAHDWVREIGTGRIRAIL